jgi:hypothetical protein
MSMEQPDGSQVDVRLFGDEFYVRGKGVEAGSARARRDGGGSFRVVAAPNPASGFRTGSQIPNCRK